VVLDLPGQAAWPGGKPRSLTFPPSGCDKSITMSLLFAFIGIPEIIILSLVILLLFGNRLPGVMRSLGQGVVEFKKGVQGIEEEDKSSAGAKKES
jgi:sec-independent protein translocase protein TatA